VRPKKQGAKVEPEGVARVYGSGDGEVRALSEIDLRVAEGTSSLRAIVTVTTVGYGDLYPKTVQVA
jgi:hypothetical protein